MRSAVGDLYTRARLGSYEMEPLLHLPLRHASHSSLRLYIRVGTGQFSELVH
jgi:hypothetical protein